MHVCDSRYLVKAEAYKLMARTACVSFGGLLADWSFSSGPRASVCLAGLAPLLLLLLSDVSHCQALNCPNIHNTCKCPQS